MKQNSDEYTNNKNEKKPDRDGFDNDIYDDDTYDDDYDEDYGSVKGRRSKLVTVFGISTAVLVILLFAVVLGSNGGGTDPKTKNTLALESSSEDDTSTETETGISTKNLRSQDLSFWDMDDDAETQSESMSDGMINDSGSKGNKDSGDTNGDIKAGDKGGNDDAEKESTVADEDNKNKTKITHSDGTTEYVNINKAIASNKYSDTGFQTEDGIMYYYDNGEKSSFAGVDISADNGDVDFKALKKSGITFVMIKLGSRGYDTGKVVLDGKYAEFMKNAADAGLNVGVYFCSQAVSEAEAVEEANFTIQNLTGYTIKYPVVFRVDDISNDTSRTEKLSADDRTKIAASFMSAVQSAGYVPSLSGDKEMLVTGVNLSSLASTKIWLRQSGDLPDYPYQFAMWQYSSKGKVDGISGNADLDISMIDFSAR